MGIAMVLSLIPMGFSCILLGAHFLRGGNFLLTLLCVLMPVLLLIKRRWILIILQSFAYAGGMVWVNTAINVMKSRAAAGLPWNKSAIILGAVALFTICSGLLLNLRVVKEKYPQ